MPNWVDNTLTVTGDEDAVNAFAERAARPHTRWGENNKYQHVEAIAFWNFLRPDDSELDEYHGREPHKATLAEALKFESNHWYDWNVRNWGCKWDASNVDMFERSSREVRYTFDTPWSPPLEFFTAVVAMYPKLDFEIRFIEEQGWGGEWHASGGTHWIVEEWEIPVTHEQSIERKAYCHCESMTEEEVQYMYDDCPKKKELANA